VQGIVGKIRQRIDLAIEETYTKKLEKGIKLSVHFEDSTKNEEDNELDFKVVIAPNDTTEAGAIEIPPKQPTKKDHDKAIKEAVQNPHLLLGRGKYSIFDGLYLDRKFRKEHYDAMNKIGKCHTTGATTPGNKSGNFTPDHQPPVSILNAGGGASVRFYPHSSEASNEQKYEVSRYKHKIRELLGKKSNKWDDKWAEGINSKWFWQYYF